MKYNRLTIHFAIGNQERQWVYLRPSKRPTPTFRGAARMVAATHNSTCPESPIKPSDVSVFQVRECAYLR